MGRWTSMMHAKVYSATIKEKNEMLLSFINRMGKWNRVRFAADCAEHVAALQTGLALKPQTTTQHNAKKSGQWAKNAELTAMGEDFYNKSHEVALFAQRAAAGSKMRDNGSPDKWDKELDWQLRRAIHYCDPAREPFFD